MLRALLITMLFCIPIVRAEPDQTHSAWDGSGAHMTNGTLSAFTAGGQSGGIGYATGSTLQNYAGFLAGTILYGDLDTDRDGLADEMDADNDGDGMIDRHELIAGTEVSNSNSLLRILAITAAGPAQQVEWQGGVVATQRLMRKRDLMDAGEPWLAIYTNLPPTDALTGTIDTTATNGPYFYRVHAERP